MSSNSAQTLLSLPTEVIKKIASLLPRHCNSRSNAIFNFSLSCKFLFSIVCPIQFRCFNGKHSPIPVNLYSIINKSHDTPSPLSEQSLLGMELHRNTRELHQSINYLQEQSYINRYLPEFVNLEALHLRLMSIPWGVREKFFTRIQTTYPNLKTLSLQVLNFTQDMRNALRNVLRDMKFIEVLHLDLWISLRTYPHDDATEQSEILSLSTEISKLHQLRDFALRYKEMSNGLNAFLGPVFRALTSTQITKLTIGYSIKLDDPTEILLRRLLEVRNLTSMRIETLSVSKDSIGEYHNFVVKSFTNSSTKSDVINPLEFNSFDVSVCARPVEKDFSHLKDLESFSYVDPGEDDEFNLNPYILRSLKESSVLRRLEFTGKDQAFFAFSGLLSSLTILDDLIMCWSLEKLPKHVADSVIAALVSCTSRSILKRLELGSDCLLDAGFFDKLLDRDIRVHEIVLNREFSERNQYFSLFQRIFGSHAVVGLKRRITFEFSKYYDYLEFDSKEHVLKLSRNFDKDAVGNIFPKVMWYAHRLVLDDVADEVVEFIRDTITAEFGVINGQYCMYPIC